MVFARTSPWVIKFKKICKIWCMELTALNSIKFVENSHRSSHGFKLAGKMIIFGSLLTTFELNIIFEAYGAVAKKLKPNQVKHFQTSDTFCM